MPNKNKYKRVTKKKYSGGTSPETTPETIPEITPEIRNTRKTKKITNTFVKPRAIHIKGYTDTTGINGDEIIKKENKELQNNIIEKEKKIAELQKYITEKENEIDNLGIDNKEKKEKINEAKEWIEYANKWMVKIKEYIHENCNSPKKNSRKKWGSPYNPDKNKDTGNILNVFPLNENTPEPPETPKKGEKIRLIKNQNFKFSKYRRVPTNKTIRIMNPLPILSSKNYKTDLFKTKNKPNYSKKSKLRFPLRRKIKIGL